MFPNLILSMLSLMYQCCLFSFLDYSALEGIELVVAVVSLYSLSPNVTLETIKKNMSLLFSGPSFFTFCS